MNFIQTNSVSISSEITPVTSSGSNSSNQASKSSCSIPIPIRKHSYLRRQSQGYSSEKIKLSREFKRRTYSLKDKSSVMTTSVYLQEDELKKEMELAKSENIPEKDLPTSPDMCTDGGDNKQDSLLMSNCSTKDSLENLKFMTYNKDNENRESINKSIPEKSKSTQNQIQPKPQTFIRERAQSIKKNDEKYDHKKAMEDMSRQYESEINLLRNQLKETLQGRTVPEQQDTLLKKCAMLESQLRQSQNEADSLSEQVNGMKVQLQTWPNKILQLEEENSTLHGRIEDVRVINQQRQNEIDELHQIVKNLETKLWEQSTGNHQQEKIFLQRLMHEYDNLLKDYEMMKLNNLTNERKLFETRNRFGELNSRISDMEMNQRRLESENNFLRRRLTNEKSFNTSNYRGWTRSTFSPQIATEYQQDFRVRNGSSQELLNQYEREQRSNEPMNSDNSMMSVSCYGALPSYNSSSGNSPHHTQQSPHHHSHQTYHSPSQPRHLPEMSQSVYVNPTEMCDSTGEIVTPTLEKRKISIQKDFQNANKRESVSFNIADQESCKSGSQTMVNSMDEIGFNRSSKMSTSVISTSNNSTSGNNNNNNNNKKRNPYGTDPWNLCRTEDERELEQTYDQLQNEKRQLLTKLSHIPNSSSARNRRTNREQKESLEAKLDQIDRQLGLLRMTLKKKNII